MTVDPHNPGTDSGCQCVGTAHVLRPDAGGQPVLGVVRFTGQIIEALAGYFHGRNHRAKNFLVVDRHARLHICQQCRQVEEPLSLGFTGSANDAGTFGDPGAHQFTDPRLLAPGNQGAQISGRVEPVAQFHCANEFGDTVDDFVVDVFMDIQPRARRTRLPAVQHDGLGHPGYGGFQIRVREHNDRAFAAQLKGHALQGRRRAGRDCLAGGRASGEGNFVHQRALHQCGATAPIAGDDVKCSGWQAGLFANGRQTQCRKRRVFSRLENDRAARRQCRRQLPCRHQQGHIPGDNLANNANRFVSGIGMPLTGQANRYAEAIELGAPARVVTKMFRRVLHIGVLDDGKGRPFVQHLKLGELLSVLVDQLANAPQDLALFRSRKPAPGARVE